MYRVFLDYGPNMREEKKFSSFNAVSSFISSIDYPPRRVHIIFTLN